MVMAELVEKLRAGEPVHDGAFDLGEMKLDASVAQPAPGSSASATRGCYGTISLEWFQHLKIPFGFQLVSAIRVGQLVAGWL
jgi:hypothetical protein